MAGFDNKDIEQQSEGENPIVSRIQQNNGHLCLQEALASIQIPTAAIDTSTFFAAATIIAFSPKIHSWRDQTSMAFQIRSMLGADAPEVDHEHVQQLEDLGCTISDGLEYLLSPANDFCGHFADKLNLAVSEYAAEMTKPNADRGCPTTNDSWNKLSPFLNAKLKFKRELRTHFSSISHMIQGEAQRIDIQMVFQPDVEALTKLADEILHYLDEGQKCETCTCPSSTPADQATRASAFKLLDSVREKQQMRKFEQMADSEKEHLENVSPSRSLSEGKGDRMSTFIKPRTFSTESPQQRAPKPSGIRAPRVISPLRSSSPLR